MDASRPSYPTSALLLLLVVTVGLTILGMQYFGASGPAVRKAETPKAAETADAPSSFTEVTAQATGAGSTAVRSAQNPVAEQAKASGGAQAPGDDMEALQNRLEALAKAYNDGNIPAAERALWKNHAVVRHTGETMYRSDLLAQWTREWDELKNRELSFVVENVEREGEAITATWAMTLTADVTDEKGESHEMEITGSQRATYTVSGDDWILEGPIVYVGFERTLDGNWWPLGQNGR